MENDLISRSALLAEMELDEPDSVDENNPEIRGMRREWKHWKRTIERFLAVDAVEVVRCKDCEHYKWQLTGVEAETMCCTINAEYDPDVGVWYGLTSYPPAEFFCADGERKTE